MPQRVRIPARPAAAPPRLALVWPAARRLRPVVLAGHPITPFMPYVPSTRPALHSERSFTNMAHSMAADKPPNRNARRGIAG